MQYHHKTLFTFSISIIFVLSVNISLAQYHPVYTPNLNQVQQIISKQNMQWQMNQMNTMRMMNLNNSYDVANYKYTYHVLLKDSTKLDVDSKIYSDTAAHKTYLLLVNKKFPKTDTANRFKKIYPQQTLSINRHAYTGFGGDMAFTGMPTDSCWLFPVETGAINAYSYLAEQSYNFNPASIAGIQLNNGVIESFNPANLKKMITADADAMKYFTKQNYYKAMVTYNKDVKKAQKKNSKL